MSRAQSARVKGRAFLAVLESLEALRGQPAVHEVLSLVSNEFAAPISPRRLKREAWYPIRDYRLLLQAIVSSNQANLIREIGADCARRDLVGPYKLLARVLRPQTLFSGALRMFRSYYDTGDVWVAATTSATAHVVWKQCDGFDRNMWVEVVGSCEGILEVGGARNLSLRVTAGGGDDDAHMEVKARWS